MNKAEKRALEAYPIVMSQYSDSCKEYDSNESDRLTFIEGYHQAETDIIKWLEENAFKYIEKQNTIFGTIKVLNSHKLVNDLKQAIKDE